MSLKLFNTYSRKLENFRPQSRRVKFYACGPTVYQRAHIGNLRTFVLYDLLQRTLQFLGYTPEMVINITDAGHLRVDDADEATDRIEKAAREAGSSADDIAKFYTRLFVTDAKALHIALPKKMPRASRHIKEQIAMIKKLVAKKYAYVAEDAVYFDTSKSKDYGKLAGLSKQTLKEGARIEPSPYKKNSSDFALWKFSKDEDRLQEWNSPWGKGFPGWHIECSAMSQKYLGNTLDLHAGGTDLIFPHHTNEIAQSEAATGKKFAKYWVHGGFLLVNGEKMSKSLNNAYALPDLEERGFDPLALRYLYMTAHYRGELNLTWDGLDASQKALNRLRLRFGGLKTKAKPSPAYLKLFKSALENDLDMPKSLDVLWTMAKDEQLSDEIKAATIKEFDKVLALDLLKPFEFEVPSEVMEWAVQREAYREEKNFQEADKLRTRIENEGFVVQDTSTGARLIPKEYA